MTRCDFRVSSASSWRTLLRDVAPAGLAAPGFPPLSPYTPMPPSAPAPAPALPFPGQAPPQIRLSHCEGWEEIENYAEIC